MNTEATLSNALLWAAAIVSAALLNAPDKLTLMILPALAAVSLVYSIARGPKRQCTPRVGAA